MKPFNNAESKGVLLVHAAGNDAKNIDTDDNFPSRNFNNDTLKVFSNLDHSWCKWSNSQ